MMTEENEHLQFGGLGSLASRLRFVPLVLIATLIAVLGCSMLVRQVNASPLVSWYSRQDNGVTTNLGTIFVSKLGSTVSLPSTTNFNTNPPAVTDITFNAPPGYYFVKWETTGSVIVANSNAQTTTLTINGDGSVTAVYSNGSSPSVGGVITPTNTLLILSPYLALIGLVATASTVYIMNRRHEA
jgi:hypothetical protein